MRTYFNSDKAYAHLRDHGYVFTIRAGGAKTPPIFFRRVQIFRHGQQVFLHHLCYRLFMTEFSFREAKVLLRPYVSSSGFLTQYEWLSEAERLSGPHDEWALYCVFATDLGYEG